jgi:predicted ATPase/DNA-binding winged helix-turn-helix (wHTH) protein
MAEAGQARSIFEAGGCEVDLGRRELRTDGVPTAIGGRAFEIIEALVRADGQLVTKDELMDRVWPGAIVGENTLQVHISAVRKALGARRNMLKTESGRGYRLLGPWTHRSAAGADVVLDRTPETGSSQTAGNLPNLAVSLFGRVASAQHLSDLLSAYRVVTLSGPGGIGKTALAFQVAHSLRDDFDDGAWVVELASLSDPALVPSTVAATLGLRLGGEVISADAVARGIGGKNLLLLLDNCEHLVDAVAELCETVVRLCPETTVLTTSREVLRIDGESVYRVSPLEVPDLGDGVPDHLLGHSAVELFVARTRALDSTFSPNRETLELATVICRHLDGIPLAIEFAAARTATLGLAQVAAGLGDRFGLLTNGRRTALPRHRTLRAVLDWSYNLLPAAERAALCRLSVLVGRFTLNAAIAIIRCDDEVSPPEAIETIANLVAKSLISTDNTAASGVRYRLLDTTRAYASAKLAERGDGDKVARHHAMFFLDALERIGADEPQPSQEGFSAYEDQLANVRAALEWSFSPRGGPRIAIGLAAAAARYFLELSLLTECLRWSELALATLDSETTGTRLELGLRISHGVSLMFTRGNTPEAYTALIRGIELAESLNDAAVQLLLLRTLHIFLTRVGHFDGAIEVSLRSQAIAKAFDDPSGMLMADWMLGVAEHLVGDQASAVAHCESAMTQVPDAQRSDMARLGFDSRMVALIALARGLWLRGYPDRAVEVARYTISETETLNNPLSLCIALIYTTYVFLWIGDLPSAQQLIERLIALTTQFSLGPYQSVAYGLRGQLLARLGERDEAIPLLRRQLESLRGARHQILATVLATALADALAQAGRADEALAVLDSAITQIGNAQSFDLPEIFRVKGAILTIAGRHDEAERSLLTALDWARKQSALGWELRAALCLGRLQVAQDRPGDARDILAPVYARFTEGFDTADLQEAKALLDTLA